MSEPAPKEPTHEALTPETADVSQYIPLDAIDQNGNLIPLDSYFLYSHDNPYAVEVLFGEEHSEQIRWTFGRDLLADGRHEPTGAEGNVFVWPSLGPIGEAVTIIELFPNDSDKNQLLQALSRDIDTFVKATETHVPIGQELGASQIGGEIDNFFDDWPE